MTTISWDKNGKYEWLGQDEKFNYDLHVIRYFPNKWVWRVWNGEYRILSSSHEDDAYFPDADQAKAAAEQALQNYLKEKTTAI